MLAISAIGPLLFHGGPTAICWLIITVVVGVSIKRKFGIWFPAHVCEESRIRFSPSVADLDTPSTIIAIELESRIMATLDHRSPRHVFRSSLSGFMTRFAVFPLVIAWEWMFMQSFACHFQVIAATTYSAAILKMRSSCPFFLSAFATTHPNSMAFDNSKKIENFETPESSTFEILYLPHARSITHS